jgi:hypothetical protein
MYFVYIENIQCYHTLLPAYKSSVLHELYWKNASYLFCAFYLGICLTTELVCFVPNFLKQI